MKTKKLSSFSHLLLLTASLALIFTGILGVATGRAQEPPRKPQEPEENNPRIETSLELLASTANSEGSAAARQHASRMGIEVNTSNSIKAIIEKKHGSLIKPTEIRGFGGEILRETDDLIEIRIPVDRIESLVDEVEGIEFLRTPYKTVTFSEVEYGSYFSTGVNLTGGGLFHSKNLLGQGVKIAVIDVGFGSYSYAKDAKEFPNGVVADKQDYTGGGFSNGGAHGTAVAEIVHDMAPLAELYLKRIDTEVSLEEATDDAIAQGVDVIVHSVGWVNTNFGDGTGVVADTTKRATENGVLWVNAAGNSAKRHWLGKATDSDDDGWVEFSGGSETITVDVNYSGTIQLFLTWNDWPESDKDFDLFLYDDNGNLVNSSQNYQTGKEPPAESISYSAGEGSYQLKVAVPEDSSFEETSLEIFSFNHQLDPYVEKSSIMAPGNVEEVLTVGSINKGDWKEGEIAYYSSRGPTEGGEIKPDLVAADGVETYVYPDFLGTSAAAPHAAGAAGLILSREPELEPEETVKALKNNTRDLGQKGPDDTYGWGKMKLIYETSSASRSLPTAEDSVEPGDKITVKVEAKMPITLQGGLSISEEVPEPLEVIEVESPTSASVSDGDISAEWPIVEPGKTKELKYSVLVPEDAPPGDYEFTGSVNGNSIEGTGNATVLEVNDVGSDQDEGLSLEGVEVEMDDFTSQLKFKASGEDIHEIKVKVYALSGKEVFESGWQPGQEYQWGLYNDSGKTVPNGVYLYYVQVRGPNGEIERSDIQKYLVLR